MSHARMFVAVVIVMVGCSDSNTFECHAPAATRYDCEPIDPATAPESSCVGGPAWRSVHGPDDAPLTHEDPDLVFPAGCRFSLAECAFYAGGRVIVCDGPSWSEPI